MKNKKIKILLTTAVILATAIYSVITLINIDNSFEKLEFTVTIDDPAPEKGDIKQMTEIITERAAHLGIPSVSIKSRADGNTVTYKLRYDPEKIVFFYCSKESIIKMLSDRGEIRLCDGDVTIVDNKADFDNFGIDRGDHEYIFFNLYDAELIGAAKESAGRGSLNLFVDGQKICDKAGYIEPDSQLFEHPDTIIFDMGDVENKYFQMEKFFIQAFREPIPFESYTVDYEIIDDVYDGIDFSHTK